MYGTLTLQPATVKCTFFSKTLGIFTKISIRLDNKTSFSLCWMWSFISFVIKISKTFYSGHYALLFTNELTGTDAQAVNRKPYFLQAAFLKNVDHASVYCASYPAMDTPTLALEEYGLVIFREAL